MQLSPETWPAVSALLDEALALPVEQRRTWLESLDGERADHKDTLRELLTRASGVETGDFLATLPRFTQAAARGPLTELAAGDVIGPYRLINELGTGGMGAVWLAERSDGQLKRKVALKLPRMVWAKGLAERMARERDILATLEHPNIARLYDAGVDQHGRPYLALEYVEGQPIDVYARERGLGVKDKLQLLLQVCSAVAFAHSRLVVHRDLKPSNILVTADGQVRLLDFGIAKLMEGDSAKETQLTQLAGRALTLDYASPEQLKGEPIGTASDVYSLGVVAYELLTGAKPYKLKRGSAAELEEAIATADPPKASDAASTPQDKKDLRGDLDAILNKALKKPSAERYPTVDSFAADLLAHLTSSKVLARPDSLMYRGRRLLHHYPGPVAVAVAVLLAAVGGLYAQLAVTVALGLGALVALWQRRRALEAARIAHLQRQRAVSALHRASAVIDLFQSLLDEASEGKPFTAVELLQRSETLALRYDADPVARAACLMSLATMYATRGNAGKAETLMRLAHESARATTDSDLAGEVVVHLGSMIARGSDPMAGKAMLERALVDFADEPEIAVHAHRALSFLAQNSNEAAAAVHHAQRALELSDQIEGGGARLRAAIVGNFAYSLTLAGRLSEAMPAFAKSMRMFETIGAQNSSVAMTIRNNWGLAALSGGDLLQALQHFDAVITASEKRGDESPPLYALTNRARVRATLRQLDATLQDALRTIELARGSSSGAVELHAQATRLHVLLMNNRLQDAIAVYEEVAGRLQDKVPQHGPARVAFRRIHALMLQAQGRHGEALGVLEDIARQMDGTGLKVGSLANLYVARAEAQRRLDRVREAIAMAEQGCEIARSAQGGLQYSFEVGNAALEVARSATALGDQQKARVAVDEALQHLRATCGAEHPFVKEAQLLQAALTRSSTPPAPTPETSTPPTRALD